MIMLQKEENFQKEKKKNQPTLKIAKIFSFLSGKLSVGRPEILYGDNFSLYPIEPKIKWDVVSPFQGDPFVGHLSTPLTTSKLTRTYLNLLPAYKTGLSPLLRGMHIGFVHGYLLLGPFVKCGPLRDSEVANFIGFLATISLIILLTSALLIYGLVTFSTSSSVSHQSTSLNFLDRVGWRQFSSGFIVGGFAGSSVGYICLNGITSGLFAF